MPYPDCDAKNFFVRDDEKRAYYLITLMGNRRVDLKEFRRRYGARPLSFASADDLRSIMGLESGSVTPLELLNDEGREATVFLDADLASGIIGVHPQRQHRHRLDAGGGSCARCREPWQRGARHRAVAKTPCGCCFSCCIEHAILAGIEPTLFTLYADRQHRASRPC
ncbi:YbaK/EbsC family protein [Collinsella tanakaei]|uniref:YbaK/EbsC family protein n=1 Tax=Collinsella tanakaei TaxID=626935 RepID=UPI003A521DBB